MTKTLALLALGTLTVILMLAGMVTVARILSLVFNAPTWDMLGVVACVGLDVILIRNRRSNR